MRIYRALIAISDARHIAELVERKTKPSAGNRWIHSKLMQTGCYCPQRLYMSISSPHPQDLSLSPGGSSKSLRIRELAYLYLHLVSWDNYLYGIACVNLWMLWRTR